jgi:hypothetical protein
MELIRIIKDWLKGYPPNSNTWQECFLDIFKVMGFLVVALVIIGIGLLLQDENTHKPHPIFTIIPFLLTVAFLFALPFLFIAIVIGLFRMPLAHKLKTLSIIFAAIGLAVVYYSIVDSIYFNQEYSTNKFVVIIICLSLSLVFWLIGKRFE